MNRPVLVLATVGLLAVLGIGAVTVGSRPSTTTRHPHPRPPRQPSRRARAVGVARSRRTWPPRRPVPLVSVTMEPLKARSATPRPGGDEKASDDASMPSASSPASQTTWSPTSWRMDCRPMTCGRRARRRAPTTATSGSCSASLSAPDNGGPPGPAVDLATERHRRRSTPSSSVRPHRLPLIPRRNRTGTSRVPDDVPVVIPALTEADLPAAVAVLATRDPGLAAIAARFGVPPLWAPRPGSRRWSTPSSSSRCSLASAKSAFDRLVAATDP